MCSNHRSSQGPRLETMGFAERKEILDRQKSINDRELLIAAGRGDLARVQSLIDDQANFNFVDRDGNTALHFAAMNGSSEVAQLLIDKMDDINTENNSNETPYDIARRLESKCIAEALEKKIIHSSLNILKEGPVVLTEDINDVSGPSGSFQQMVNQEIRRTEEKIKCCLESLEKLNGVNNGVNDLSYEAANVFIYFIEAFALEGSGSEEIRTKLKEHFFFYEELFSDARRLLLKETANPARELTLDDIRKFIKGDINCFFKNLEMYVKDVCLKLTNDKHEMSQIQLCSLFDTPKKEERKLGKTITDVGSFIKEKFIGLIKAAYTHKKLTPEELFNFTVNFYPAIKGDTNSDFKEMSDLRNKLIHQFHKYGYVEFGNEIYSLRSTLFKYYYAQEAFKILSAAEPDDNPQTISDNLKAELETFNTYFQNDFEADQVVSQDEAKGFFGYKFSRSLFPEEYDDVEDLVVRYLKFMTILDREKAEEETMTAEEETMTAEEETMTAEEETMATVENEEIPCLNQSEELNDVTRREIFENFDRLKRIKEYCPRRYEDEKKKLRDELVGNYGINGRHFDKVCAYHEEGSNNFLQNNEIKIMEIVKSIKSIKRIKDNYQLPNQIIVSFFKQLTDKQGITRRGEIDALDSEQQKQIRNEIPRDETMDLSFGNEIFHINTVKIITNMLKTFYNAYHKYKIQFSAEDIFNDETFLSYLVRKSIEEKNITELVDQYFKFVFPIECGKLAGKGNAQQFTNFEKREIFENFSKLKKSQKHVGFYDKEKKRLRNLFAKDYGINRCEFDKICQLFIENDHEFEQKTELERVKRAIDTLRSLKLRNQIISSLYNLIVEGRGKIDLQNVKSLVMDTKKANKIKKILEEMYEKSELKTAKINTFIDENQLSVPTERIIKDILQTFKESLQFKNTRSIYMIIKKILNIEYTAPFIVKLMTEVRSDDVIEKNDLIRLVQILSVKTDELYICRLSELLNIKSGKLNVYEVIYDTMYNEQFKPENVHLLFKKVQNASGILEILEEKIENLNDEEKSETFEKTEKILKVLTNRAYDWYRTICCKDALKILKGIEKLHQKLLHHRRTERISFIYIEVKLLIGRIKNQQGKMDKNKMNKSRFHSEALSIFQDIIDALKENKHNFNFSCWSGDTEVDQAHLRLLVLAEIAYTKNLLQYFEEAYKDYQTLFEEVIKLVFNLPEANNSPDGCLSYERYNDITRSEKYQKLLARSDESRNYLEVLEIKKAIAYSKAAWGIREFADSKDDKALTHMNAALRIYKNIYAFNKKSQGFPKKVIISVLSQIGYINFQIGHLLSKRRYDRYENPTAHNRKQQEYYFVSLLANHKIYKVYNDIYWPNHPLVTKGRNIIASTMCKIADTYNMMGGTTQNTEGKQEHKTALDIYKNVYNIAFEQKETDLIFKTLTGIACVYDNISRFEEADEVDEVTQKLYDNRKEMFGGHSEHTKKIKACLKKRRMQRKYIRNIHANLCDQLLN